ncbi:InlB B-repeat-containing protein [Flavobacterium capsici]|uniref:InlB B-repeat-containing protein n=1 Tax=Flavobacterium capsici TaxID=3075618 RepID=A0AA96J974_9FLAO|nr:MULTISPECIES: InlB B-repeat-containing protein [unclassified Flavobacterium]WNM20219.1 InlB B-repeat-containing protein [Flavobacterium sp. PMR2A8]WNM21609.1 InlB B-repeat-containing protein [Flavobacterium sp. PMTSA4]
MKNILLFRKPTRLLFLSFALLFLLSQGKGYAQYSGSGTFTQISSLSSLTDGYYVIAFGATQAMNNTLNAGNYFQNTAISPSSGTLTNPSATIVWFIQTNGSDRTIYNENSSKFVSYTGSSNAAFATSTVTGNSEKWTFAYTSSLFTITNVGSSTRLLQYNSGSPRFACYTGSQQNITLYKMTPPNPTTTSISPNSAVSGGSGFTLTVNGTNFLNGLSAVTWNGASRATTFVSSTQLTATILAADIASVGSANVGVTTTGAAAASNTQVFTINAASAPSLAITGNTAHGSSCPGTPNATIQYTITNSGTTANNVVVTSSNPTEFVVTNAPTTVNGSGGTATYNVTFTPSSNGAKSATISVYYDTTTLGANSSLTGTGVNPTPQSVTSSGATAVVNTTATLNGNATFGVCPDTTLKGFVYSKDSENSNPTVGGTSVTNVVAPSLGAAGAYTTALSGLTPNTLYQFKAYVYDGTTYIYSNPQSFTTKQVASKLSFGVAPPTTGSIGVNLTAFTVLAQRPDNTTDTEYTSSVSLAKGTVSGSANLTGNTANAVAGVATFSTAKFDAIGTYNLTATSGALINSATSNNIVITLPNSTANSWSNTGASSAWCTAGNWSTGSVPTITEVATWNDTGSATISGITFSNCVPTILGIEVTSLRTRDLTIGSSASTSGTLTLNGGVINGVSNTIIRNNSTSVLTLQPNVSSSAPMSITLGGTINNFINTSNTGDIVISAVINGGPSNPLTKAGSGSGVLILSNPANTYSGTTTITQGRLRLSPSSSPATFASPIVMNGGILSTLNILTGTTMTSSATIGLTESSGIDLGSNPHSLKFAASNAVSWTAGKTITITGWTGTAGVSGTAGKLFVGTSAAGLTVSQLNQIVFQGYSNGTTILSTGEVVPRAPYTVTYNANGGTGTQTDANPYNNGDIVTVLGAGTITRTGYTFANWNTAANGSGTTYSQGNTFAISADTTLYAQWTINTYTITYDSNSGTGTQSDPNSPYNYNTTVTVLGIGSVTKPGFTFTFWDTNANGTGTSYTPGDTFTITDNTVLYAQWISNSAPNCPVLTSTAPDSEQSVCQGFSANELTATVNTAGSIGTPTISYQWYYNTTDSNTIAGATEIVGATNANYTPLTSASEAGTTRYYFCVGYASDNGCNQTKTAQSLASNPVKVTVYATPATPTITPSGSTTFENGGSVLLTSSVGSSYLWSNNATTQSITATVSGSYSVQVSVNGCFSDSSSPTTVFVVPSVTTTSPATTVTYNSATLSGNVTNTGGSNITATGIVYALTSQNTTPTIGGVNVVQLATAAPNTGIGSFSENTGMVLTDNKQYSFRAYATSSQGTSYGSVVTFTTANLTAPIAAVASNIKSNSFVANWGAVPGATGYRLDVSTSPTFSTPTEILNQGFESATFPPTGWLNSGWSRSTSSGDINSGSAAAIAGSQSGTLTSGALSNPSSLAFYLGRSTNSTAKTLTVEVSTTSQTTGFTTVATFDHSNVPSGSYNQYNVDLSAYSSNSEVYVRFVKSSSTTSPWRLDDIVITGAFPSYISGYENLAVAGLSQVVSGLNPQTTYYYRVRAESTNSTSVNSNVIEVTTAATPPTITGVSQTVDVVCDGNEGVFNVTGLLPNIQAILTYSTSTGSHTVSVNPNASGFAQFLSVPLSFSADNGNSLTITKVERTDTNQFTNVSVSTSITVSPQPLWYLDADNDGYYTGSGVLSCDSPGEGYTTTVLPGGDCNDNDPLIHPGAAEICYDGIDNDCDGSLTNGCPAVTTTFWTSVCGQTLAALNTSIRPYYTFSNNLPVGVLVTGYKFMITDLATNQVREVEKANGMIRITDTDIASYGRSYSIKVAIKLNAEWQPYNSENCTVTTPSIPTTTVSNCGTLAAINSPIYATSVANATRYRYTITRMGGEMNDVELESQTFTRTGNFVRLTELTTVPILYNAIYKVNVSAESLLGGVLTFSAPGTCYMSSPAEPVLQYESCQNGGLAPSSMTTPLYVTPYTGSPMYRYIVENEISGYSQTIETITRYVRLSQFNALAPLQAGGTYRIRIQIQLYGVYYEGKDCEVTVPGGSSSGSMPSRVMEQPLEAIAYPNPFANNFQLNIKTTNTSAVSIKVYDMLGRLIEQREESVNDLETTTIGDNYPSGVYNVIVAQQDEVKTLRVVKR